MICSIQNWTGSRPAAYPRNTADLTESVIDEAGAFTIVDFVIAEAGQFCPGRQPRLALAHSLVGALPSQRIGKYLRQELQALQPARPSSRVGPAWY